MQPQYPPSPARYALRQIAIRISLALCLSCLIYLIWWGFAIHPKQEAEWHAQIQAYESSPGCTATSPAVSHLPPCSFLEERIVSARSHSYKSSTDYYLTLQALNGALQEVKLYGSQLWHATNIGDYVKVKYWDGDIVSVSGFGYNTMTRNNPELLRSAWDPGAALVGFLALTCAGFCALGIWANRYEARRNAPALPELIPPAKDYW